VELKAADVLGRRGVRRPPEKLSEAPVDAEVKLLKTAV